MRINNHIFGIFRYFSPKDERGVVFIVWYISVEQLCICCQSWTMFCKDGEQAIFNKIFIKRNNREEFQRSFIVHEHFTLAIFLKAELFYNQGQSNRLSGTDSFFVNFDMLELCYLFQTLHGDHSRGITADKYLSECVLGLH